MSSVVEVKFDVDEENHAVSEVVRKLRALPVEERLWPNYLGRSIRNSSVVNVKEFISKLNKSLPPLDGVSSKKGPAKTIATRTRSKAAVVATMTRASCTISSDSLESPKDDKGVEANSSRLFVKGMRLLVRLLIFMLLAISCLILFMVIFEHCYQFAEFKTPILRPPEMSSKELFAKRAREDRPVETESSKTPMLGSPEAKRPKSVPSASGMRSEPNPPMIFYGYNAHAKPTEFAHLLDDLLLPQYIDSSDRKSPETLLNEASGYAFHVSLSVHRVNSLAMSSSIGFVTMSSHLCRVFRVP